MPGTFLSTYLYTFSLHNNQQGKFVITLQMTNLRKPERLSTLTKVTQLVNGRAKIQTQAVSLCSQVFNQCTHCLLRELGKLHVQPLHTTSFLTRTESETDSCPTQHCPFLLTSESLFFRQTSGPGIPSLVLVIYQAASTDKLPATPPHCCSGDLDQETDRLEEGKWTFGSLSYLTLQAATSCDGPHGKWNDPFWVKGIIGPQSQKEQQS